MEKYIDTMVKHIIDLTNIPSPSGNTEKAINYIKDELDKYGVPNRMTNKGGLIASLKGTSGSGSRTISAHVDTLGAMVKGIKENGRLSFSKIGGYALNSIECENCFIETNSGNTYSGVIYMTSPSVHIDHDMGKYERKLENMEIVLDEKVFSKEDVLKLGIDVGDFVSFHARSQVTNSGFIKSRHLDDKASVGVILGVLQYFAENGLSPAFDTHLYFTNYEEVSHGAASCVPPDTLNF